MKNLSKKEKEILVHHHTCSDYRKGEIIFKEGEIPAGLIMLASGKMKIFKDGIGGREQIVKMAAPFDFIGYRSLFSESPFTFSAAAIEDSTICIFDKDIFNKILLKNAGLALEFIMKMAEELSFANNRIVSLSQKHIRGRLAESLLILRDTYGVEKESQVINVLLSREDIAHLSNMTTSNAIRTLSIFASEQVISVEGRKIAILDNLRLRKISELG